MGLYYGTRKEYKTVNKYKNTPLVLIATNDDEESLIAVKEYLMANGYTSETARILRKDGILWAEKKMMV